MPPCHVFHDGAVRRPLVRSSSVNTFILWCSLASLPRLQWPMKVSSTSTAPPPAERREFTGAHGLANAMGQKPRALVGGFQGAVDLVALTPFLGAHQVDRLEPLRHRQVLSSKIVPMRTVNCLPQSPHFFRPCGSRLAGLAVIAVILPMQPQWWHTGPCGQISLPPW